MSIQYKAVILIGLPFKKVFNSVEEYENLDYGIYASSELKVILPFYDAGLEDSLVGIPLVESRSFNYKNIATSMDTQKSRELFKLITGKEAKVYLTTSWY